MKLMRGLSVSGSSDGSSKKFLTDFLQEFPTPGTGPYFDTTTPANVTGLVGKNVHLVCKVKNLGNRTVSTAAIDTRLRSERSDIRGGAGVCMRRSCAHRRKSDCVSALHARRRGSIAIRE